MVASMLGIFQNDTDTYNERIGYTIGWILGALLFVVAIVWLINDLAEDDAVLRYDICR